LLGVFEDGRVLEVGTGSGYQAAVLGELCDQVYSIEIVEPLGLLVRRGRIGVRLRRTQCKSALGRTRGKSAGGGLRLRRTA